MFVWCHCAACVTILQSILLDPYVETRLEKPNFDQMKLVGSTPTHRDQLRAERARIEAGYADLTNDERKAEAERILKEESFATPDDRLILYSGQSPSAPEKIDGRHLPKDGSLDARGNNYQRAKLLTDFDQAANPDPKDAWHMMSHTPGGHRLNALYRTRGKQDEVMANLKKDYDMSEAEYNAMWARASEKLVRAQKGETRAFVDGASDRSIYAKVEAPAAFDDGKSINGVQECPDKTLEGRRQAIQQTKEKDIELRGAARRGVSAKKPVSRDRS